MHAAGPLPDQQGMLMRGTMIPMAPPPQPSPLAVLAPGSAHLGAPGAVAHSPAAPAPAAGRAPPPPPPPSPAMLMPPSPRGAAAVAAHSPYGTSGPVAGAPGLVSHLAASPGRAASPPILGPPGVAAAAHAQQTSPPPGALLHPGVLGGAGAPASPGGTLLSPGHLVVSGGAPSAALLPRSPQPHGGGGGPHRGGQMGHRGGSRTSPLVSGPLYPGRQPSPSPPARPVTPASAALPAPLIMSAGGPAGGGVAMAPVAAVPGGVPILSVPVAGGLGSVSAATAAAMAAMGTPPQTPPAAMGSIVPPPPPPPPAPHMGAMGLAGGAVPHEAAVMMQPPMGAASFAPHATMITTGTGRPCSYICVRY